jgi:hypothetical protein
VRHARHWAIECADDALSNEHMLPPGFALRGWGDVWRWLAEELEEPVGDPREETLLLGLQSTLAGMGSALGVSRQPAPSSLPPTPAAVGHPRPTPSREMAQGYDLAAVYRAVSRLYGKNGGHRVASSDCREDVALMRSAFEDAGTEIPRGLSGNVMTPRRVLTVLYSGEGLSDATPASWTELRMRVLERGGDRGTLVAMLGWAAAHPNTEASRRLHRTTARVWGETPDTLPGMPELHAALSRTRE